MLTVYIKDHENFCAPYLEAKGRFYELFISRMKKIAELIDQDYVKAFHSFETNKGNYEFTIEISLQPEYFQVNSMRVLWLVHFSLQCWMVNNLSRCFIAGKICVKMMEDQVSITS